VLELSRERVKALEALKDGALEDLVRRSARERLLLLLLALALGLHVVHSGCVAGHWLLLLLLALALGLHVVHSGRVAGHWLLLLVVVVHHD